MKKLVICYNGRKKNGSREYPKYTVFEGGYVIEDSFGSKEELKMWLDINNLKISKTTHEKIRMKKFNKKDGYGFRIMGKPFRLIRKYI